MKALLILLVLIAVVSIGKFFWDKFQPEDGPIIRASVVGYSKTPAPVYKHPDGGMAEELTIPGELIRVDGIVCKYCGGELNNNFLAEIRKREAEERTILRSPVSFHKNCGLANGWVEVPNRQVEGNIYEIRSHKSQGPAT